MKHPESGKSPVIHANLSNLERELRQLVGTTRMPEGSNTTASGDHAHSPDSAVIADD